MFNQHELAANEKPQVAGCWPVFTHANVAVETARISAAPEGIKLESICRMSEGRLYEEVLQAR